MDRVSLLGCVDAVAVAAGVARERVPVSAAVAAQMRRLDASQLDSPARQYRS